MTNNLAQDDVYPEWQKTEPIQVKGGDSVRNYIADRFDLAKFYVFLASDPAEAKEAGVGKWPGTGLGIPVMRFPFRVFVAPRSDIGKIVHRFDVGWSYSEDPNFRHELVNRINVINSIIRMDLVDVRPLSMQFLFSQKLDFNTALRIQDSFYLLKVCPLKLGLEPYVLSWDPALEPCPVAEKIYNDQKLTFWWEG